MPKVKMARKSTNIDMTAMCDVAFLLLTFFMLAAKTKKPEPVMVSTPSSISQITIPDTSIMLITVDSRNRVFFSIDKKRKVPGRDPDSFEARRGLIMDMNAYKNLGLTAEEVNNFQTGTSIGVPIANLKQYLSSDAPTQAKIDQQTPGIPIDTSIDNPNNELAQWIRLARNNNPMLRICIKADAATKYPAVDKIISTLGSMKLFRFNLITNLEEVPPGTAAYNNAQKTTKG